MRRAGLRAVLPGSLNQHIEYIESLNNNIGKKIGDRNREVLEFIKRNKEELLASIQRLANKR